MTYHPLPGGRFAAERRRELPGLALAVARFFGVGAWPALRVAGDPVAFTEEAQRWSRKVLRWLDPELSVSGVDRVDWSKPHVVVPLHESMVDPILLLATLPSRLRFAVRTEIATWPVVGRVLAPSHQILVDPEAATAAARHLLRAGHDAIVEGFSPVVFAQGTLLGIEAAFGRGAFTLARRAGVDVVPVVIAGTHRVYEWPFHPVVRKAQPIHLEVLTPRHDPDPAALEREMRTVALANAHAPVRRFEPDRDGWWDGYRFSISDDYPGLAARLADHRAQFSSRRAIT